MLKISTVHNLKYIVYKLVQFLVCGFLRITYDFIGSAAEGTVPNFIVLLIFEYSIQFFGLTTSYLLIFKYGFELFRY